MLASLPPAYSQWWLQEVHEPSGQPVEPWGKAPSPVPGLQVLRNPQLWWYDRDGHDRGGGDDVSIRVLLQSVPQRGKVLPAPAVPGKLTEWCWFHP